MCEIVKLIVIMFKGLIPVIIKYINDIHGNTIQVDKSTGFHVLELHGMTAGVTSSLLIGAMMLLCSAYFCYKVGLTKMLRCCCDCLNQGGAHVGTERLQVLAVQNFPVMTAQPVQQQHAAAAVLQGVEQYGTLDLPKGLTLKMIQ